MTSSSSIEEDYQTLKEYTSPCEVLAASKTEGLKSRKLCFFHSLLMCMCVSVMCVDGSYQNDMLAFDII